MKYHIHSNADTLGQAAAKRSAKIIQDAINEKGEARVIFSTGASQFETIQSLLKEDIDWSKVVGFHLDEYIGLDESHPASFVKYLKERLVNYVSFKAFYFVSPWEGTDNTINHCTKALLDSPIDLGLIGIGENAHIAFNDPPAQFDVQEAYHVVTLDDACRHQQMGEGWFKTLNEVPTQAISMSVHQILQCKRIICAVPHRVKALAILNTIQSEPMNPWVPSSALKIHQDVEVYLDYGSSSLVPKEVLNEIHT